MKKTHAAALAVAALATTILAGPGSPAYAEDAPARLILEEQPPQVLQPGEDYSQGLNAKADVTGSGTLTGIVMTVDTSAIAAFADVTVADYDMTGCTAAGAVWTCVLPDVRYGNTGREYLQTPTMKVTARTGVLGTGDVTIGLTAAGAQAVNTTQRVSVQEAVTLEMGGMPEWTVAPGATVSFDAPITNTGTNAVYNPVLVAQMPDVELVGPVPANCVTGTVYEYTRTMVCRFDAVVAPGETYKVHLAYQVRADQKSGGLHGYVHWDGNGFDASELEGAVQGTGPVLTLPGAKPSPADVPLQHDFRDTPGWLGLAIIVVGPDASDLVALGTTLPAKPGYAKLVIGVRNDGPTAIEDGRSGDPATAVWFTLPKGVTAVSLPPDTCHQPAPGEWSGPLPGTIVCTKYGGIPVGGTMRIGLVVKIDSVDLTQKGSVIVGHGFYGGDQPYFDRDPSNSTAEILFEGATPGPGTSTGPSQSPTAGPGTGTKPDAEGKDSAESLLASTGFKVGTAAVIGLALAVAGVIVLRTTRRRANAAAGAAEVPEASADE